MSSFGTGRNQISIALSDAFILAAATCLIDLFFVGLVGEQF